MFVFTGGLKLMATEEGKLMFTTRGKLKRLQEEENRC
jgi:hypothetical protein